MGIFQKKPTIRQFTDSMTINGCQFNAEIGISEKRGDPLAIHGGRILSFYLYWVPDEENEELVGYFEDGKWVLQPDDSFGEAELALCALVEKWRTYTPKKGDTCNERKDSESNTVDIHGADHSALFRADI